MPRADITDKLVHFTTGVSTEDAFSNLCSMLDERHIRGSGRLIRGGYSCVCFTEAPLISLADGLVNPQAYSRYSPFGILFEKKWISGQGGRPVIYQPDVEYLALPEALRWRHMRYEPAADPPVDFTWEREWRLQCDDLPLEPIHAAIVLPDGEWADRLREAHDEEQAWRVFEYQQIMDATLAEQYREEFGWRIVPLG
jgi:hypothetical protein